MAKKSIFDFDKWERKHVAQMGARSKAIKRLFDDLAHQASLLGIDVNLESDEEFNFKDYPALEKRIDELVKEVAKKVTKEITDAEEEAWLQANAKNDALVDAVVKGTGVPKEVVSQWKQPNLNALVAFQARKIAGMGLSRRVWALTKSAKQELELALDIGIGEGKSAAELSRDIRQYLNEPDKLFRRVRDKHGILRLSKAAQAYHPGRGVYRSSYKNALRLAQTEINMAYRSADHERWGQEPWVIGQRICLSNNHTLNGLPFHDICDDVQGVYPKDFKFVGWHPKCRCYKIPELAKREERIAYLKKMVNGEDVSGYKFSGEVKEVPERFNKWLQDNAERIQRAEGRGTLPYFLRDNGSFFTHDKEGLLKLAPRKKTPLEIAVERHAMRTPEQAKAIQERWDAKRAQDNLIKKTANNVLNVAKKYSEVDITALETALRENKIGLIRQYIQQAVNQIKGVRKSLLASYNPALNSVYPKATKEVIKQENIIRKNNFETAIVVNKEGKIILTKGGQQYSVGFTKQELSFFKDCVMTHNHPRGWSFKENTLGRIGNSFSFEDILLAIQCDVAEIRAVTPTHTFILQRPSSGWGITIEEMKKELGKEEKRVKNKLQQVVYNAKNGHFNVAVERAQALHFHLIIKNVAKRLGYIYKYTKSV